LRFLYLVYPVVKSSFVGHIPFGNVSGNFAGELVNYSSTNAKDEPAESTVNSGCRDIHLLY